MGRCQIHCEIKPPSSPNQPIQRYSWSVWTGSYRASGATRSLAESKQAVELEAAVLKQRRT